MAAPRPLLLKEAIEQTKNPTRIHIQSYSTKPEPAASNRPGRKPSKAPPARKKQPQRGMGVAQLERLRLQERWMQMTETNQQLESSNLQPIQPTQLVASDPIHSVPVQFGSVNCSIPMIKAGGFLSFDQGIVVKRFENCGFTESIGNPSSGHFLTNPYVFGAPDTRVRAGTQVSASESSFEELSSKPKMTQHYDQKPCDACCKKKKFINGDQNIGYNAGREKFSEIFPANGSDFQGFGARAAKSAFIANNNSHSEGAEVVATKANPRRENIFMEYEFFPGKAENGKNSTFFKEMEFQISADSSASNSIDLTLRL